MRILKKLLVIAALSIGVPLHAAGPHVLRIASAFDPQSMDPHAVALLYHTRVAFQIHDSLVNRDEQFRQIGRASCRERV